MRTPQHGNYFTKASSSGRQSFQRLLQTYSDLISNPPPTVSPGRLEALRLHAAAHVFKAALTRRGKPGYNHLAIGRDVAEMAKSAPVGRKSSMNHLTADKLLMDTYHSMIETRPFLRARLFGKPAQRALDSIDQAYQERADAIEKRDAIIMDATACIAEARTVLRERTDARDQLLAGAVAAPELLRACDAVEAAAAAFVRAMREQNERISRAGRAVDEAQARLQAAREAHLAAIGAKGDE